VSAREKVAYSAKEFPSLKLNLPLVIEILPFTLLFVGAEASAGHLPFVTVP
jgi:hypothetical protein